MLQDILSVIWIFSPVGIANMAPVIAKNVPILKHLDQPLDFNKTFRGKRIFGEHKTIRGLLAGILFGLLAVCLQVLLTVAFDWPESISQSINYGRPLVLLMGMCMGFGAITGDAIESFFKRQLNIKPGQSWPPFDQLDFLIGGFIAALPFFVLPFTHYLLAIFIGLIMHPTFNVISWLLRLQDKPF